MILRLRHLPAAVGPRDRVTRPHAHLGSLLRVGTLRHRAVQGPVLDEIFLRDCDGEKGGSLLVCWEDRARPATLWGRTPAQPLSEGKGVAAVTEKDPTKVANMGEHCRCFVSPWQGLQSPILAAYEPQHTREKVGY